jgi:hypothetical protein
MWLGKVVSLERFGTAPTCEGYMKPNHTISKRNAGSVDPIWPENLATRIPAGELVQWTLEGVQTFFWNGGTGTTLVGNAFNPRVLLTIMTFGYATGVFASEDIAEHCRSDSVFRHLSVGIRCAPDRLRRFRGQNCELIKRCLAFVLRRAHERGAATASPELSGDSRTESTAVMPTATARLVLSQQEAKRRFERAVSADWIGEDLGAANGRGVTRRLTGDSLATVAGIVR